MTTQRQCYTCRYVKCNIAATALSYARLSVAKGAFEESAREPLGYVALKYQDLDEASEGKIKVKLGAV